MCETHEKENVQYMSCCMLNDFQTILELLYNCAKEAKNII